MMVRRWSPRDVGLPDSRPVGEPVVSGVHQHVPEPQLVTDLPGTLSLDLDAATMAWLERLADEQDRPASEVAEWMLRELRLDDEAEEGASNA